MGVFSSQEKFLLLLQFLRYLRTFQGPSLRVLNFVTSVFFEIFAIFVMGVFSSQERSLLLLRFCDICDICRHFGALLGFSAF